MFWSCSFLTQMILLLLLVLCPFLGGNSHAEGEGRLSPRSPELIVQRIVMQNFTVRGSLLKFSGCSAMQQYRKKFSLSLSFIFHLRSQLSLKDLVLGISDKLVSFPCALLDDALQVSRELCSTH